MIKKAPPVIKRSAFLPIASPRLVKGPPTGGDWRHEIKFDGFRLQAHKLGADVRLFSKNGKDFKTIDVTYNDGQSKTILVPPTAPIIAFEKADKSIWSGVRRSSQSRPRTARRSMASSSQLVRTVLSRLCDRP